MRSNRSISLPVSFAVTCCVWFAFLWTMQNAPPSRRAANGDDFSGARSSGGLANNFASAVVRFFDDQDPRELAEGIAGPEPVFDAEMPEYLPLPKDERRELAKELPEVFANLSLTARNLFRSDVDLDGDQDLDLALLVRVSKHEGLGAVLEYVGDGEFRFAGKFSCEYERAEDFWKCFLVVRTGGGAMHVLSRTDNLRAAVEQREQEDLAPLTPTTGGRPVAGWRWMRLQGGSLVEHGSFVEPGCTAVRRGEPSQPSLDVEPVPLTEMDLFRFVGHCQDTQVCVVYRYDPDAPAYSRVENPGPALCGDEDGPK